MTVDINYGYRDEDVQQAIEAYIIAGKVPKSGGGVGYSIDQSGT